MPQTVGQSTLVQGMPSRNVDCNHRETPAEVDRGIPERRVGTHAQATLCSAVATPTGDATDDGAASTILAQPESMRRTPEQDAKLQAVGQLAGNVAHDFNNIFTSVLGNLQLIQRRAGNDHQVGQMVGAAIEASRRGTDLTNRLLAFSQHREVNLEVFDANSLLTGMGKVLRRTVGSRINIGIKLTEGLWKVRADSTHLESAILSLAINAREAMPEGGTLTIETDNIAFGDLAAWHPALEAHDYVRISVGDTGCGMERDLIGRIFEPFFTTKPRHRHAGLGLNMVSAFVEQCHGPLTVRSSPGKGTSFNFFLPAVLTTGPAPVDGEGSDAGNPSGLA